MNKRLTTFAAYIKIENCYKLIRSATFKILLKFSTINLGFVQSPGVKISLNQTIFVQNNVFGALIK